MPLLRSARSRRSRRGCRHAGRTGRPGRPGLVAAVGAQRVAGGAFREQLRAAPRAAGPRGGPAQQPAVARVPDPDRPVGSAAEQPRTVRREGQATRPAARRRPARDGGASAACQTSTSPLAPALAISRPSRAGGKRQDRLLGAGELADADAAGEVPRAHRSVDRAGNQLPSGRTAGRSGRNRGAGRCRTSVPSALRQIRSEPSCAASQQGLPSGGVGERVDPLARLVPAAAAPLPSGRRQRCTPPSQPPAATSVPSGERATAPSLAPARAGACAAPRGEAPDGDRAVVAGRDRRPAVGGQRHGVDRPVMALEPGDTGLVGQAPDDKAVVESGGDGDAVVCATGYAA